jgi:hypothetical protein
VGAGQRIHEWKEILKESRVTVQQHDGWAGAPIHIVEAGAVDGKEPSDRRKACFSATNLELRVERERAKNR